MLPLRGINLPLRQKELNKNVKEAIDEKVPFESLKKQQEASDVDKLFKIDVASHYKNIDYMLEIFKSGDSLYISRALKSLWIYNDTYSNIINPDYLHDNIFPHMSIKMKKKLLTTASMHLRTEDRLIAFFNYCIGKKFINIALKFLLYASESFKLEVINEKEVLIDFVNDETDYSKHFFGESFLVLEAYFNSLDSQAWPLLYRLRDMYSVNNIKYLQLVEKYGKVEYKMLQGTLGLRMSKDIMTKHKDRVLKNPLLYLPILNKKMIAKFSNVEDAKLIAIALLPKKASVFWHDNFRWTNKYILDIIPKEDLFDFLKKIFMDAYPGEKFEMCANFYNYHFYDLLSIEKREQWALKHIESQKEILGQGQDFKWYSFVNFDTALAGIKKYIMKTPDKDRRSEILNVLIEAAKTQRHLEKLFKYYYDRHVNESPSNKEQFMNAIITNHNVFEFDEDCWDAFNKILYSMEIYSNSGILYMTDFRLIVVIYCIVRGKEIPELLKENLYSCFNHLYIEKLTEEKRVILYDYLINLYTEKVQEFEGQDYVGDVKKSITQYINLVLRVMVIFDKTKEECPDIIMIYIDMDWDDYKNHHIFKQKVEITLLEEYDLIRQLKEDATLISDTFHDLRITMNNSYSFKLNQLMRKLRVYFFHDIANEFLNFFISLLTEPENVALSINTSVYCIFQLADDKFKIDFMCQYAPVEPKIDHRNIDRTLLYIRESICRFSCYSRPPVPLEMVLMYLKGDYVHYCLPIFGHYFVNLPYPLAMKFIEATLNAPLSIQKHGIRLAFKSYSAEDLSKLITSVWKKTKNVSLRLILYEKLFEKVLSEDDEFEILHEALKMFTSDLNDEDDKEIFSLITSGRMPENLVGDFLVTAWTAVSKFSEKTVNMERQTLVLRSMKSNINLMDRSFVLKNIVEPHIQEMLTEKKIRPSYKTREFSERVKTKWELIAKFIVTFKTDEDSKTSIELANSIIRICAEMWDVVHGEIYTLRLFFKNFISSMRANSNSHFNNFKDVNRVFDTILRTILDILPFKEIYLTVWDLWLIILTRKVCAKLKYNDSEKFECVDDESVCQDYATEVGNLVQDLVNKRKFYRSFLPEITALVNNHITVFSSAIDRNVDLVRLMICNGLAQYKMTEIHLLALMMLPADCPDPYYNKCKNVMQKFKEIDNDEIQCFLYQKFVRCDFKRRKFV